MNIDSLIGQHFILGFQGHNLTDTNPIYTDITSRNLGGVILFDRFLHGNKEVNNIRSSVQLQSLCRSLQKAADNRLIIAIDQEGGRVRRLKEIHGFPPVPSAAAMGEKVDCSTTTQVALSTGELLAGLGINMNFAPVADVNVNPENPIIGRLDRSFSPEPEEVVHHCLAWLEGLRQHNVMGCLKHFPGHGSSTVDSHKGFVDISNSWQEFELLPYEKIIPTGKAGAIMMGHLYLRHLDQQYPASLSKKIITELLRQRLNYSGIVITDDLQMKGVTEKYGILDAIVLSLAAGADLLIIGNNLDYDPDILKKAINHVKKALQRGDLDEDLLLQSSQRISTLKDILYEQSSD